jgi:hypothetical protein
VSLRADHWNQPSLNNREKEEDDSKKNQTDTYLTLRREHTFNHWSFRRRERVELKNSSDYTGWKRPK